MTENASAYINKQIQSLALPFFELLSLFCGTCKYSHMRLLFFGVRKYTHTCSLSLAVRANMHIYAFALFERVQALSYVPTR